MYLWISLYSNIALVSLSTVIDAKTSLWGRRTFLLLFYVSLQPKCFNGQVTHWYTGNKKSKKAEDCSNKGACKHAGISISNLTSKLHRCMYIGEIIKYMYMYLKEHKFTPASTNQAINNKKKVIHVTEFTLQMWPMNVAFNPEWILQCKHSLTMQEKSADTGSGKGVWKSQKLWHLFFTNQ